MKFLLGQKLEMTQYFSADGRAHAATLVHASPITVLQKKTVEKDGYSAIQVGFGERKEKNISKPQKGHFKDMGNFRFVKEFRVEQSDLANYEVGAVINPDTLQAGDVVRVSGISKGKGFQGVVKRHGFAGGPRTHGQKHSEREPGSIGGGGGRAGGRVAKGIRMAGRMGSDRITVKNLSILAVDPQAQVVVIKGALPGKRGTLLEIIG
jgi:large subunit ribosomal protein L3